MLIEIRIHFAENSTCAIRRYERRSTVPNQANFFGIKCLDLDQGFAHLEMPTTKEFSNWNGKVMGGVTGALMDLACGAAVETLIDFDEEPIATFSLQTNFTTPAKIGDVLCAKASTGMTYYVHAGNKFKNDNPASIPVIEVPQGGKKILVVHVSVISKPARDEIANGNGYFVIFGKKRKQW